MFDEIYNLINYGAIAKKPKQYTDNDIWMPTTNRKRKIKKNNAYFGWKSVVAIRWRTKERVREEKISFLHICIFHYIYFSVFFFLFVLPVALHRIIEQIGQALALPHQQHTPYRHKCTNVFVAWYNSHFTCSMHIIHSYILTDLNGSIFIGYFRATWRGKKENGNSRDILILLHFYSRTMGWR